MAETPPGFRLGTSIRVSLSSSVAPRIELPLTALQDVDGKTRIWVVDATAKTVAPRDITVLSRSGSVAILAGGVSQGERVVSAGVHSLKPGQKVKIDEGSPQ